MSTPESRPAIEARAALLLRQGQHAAAEALYRQLLASGHASAAALGNLAALCGQREHWEEMLVLLEKQLALAPAHPLVHRNRGLALLKLGRWEESLAAYREAVQRHREDWQNWFGLADACREQGKIPEAMQAYRQCLTLNPGCVGAANNLGGLLHAQGNYEDALDFYQRAIRADCQCAESHNNCGNLLRELGRLDEAIGALQRAIRLRPDFALAHVNLGLAYLVVGNDLAAKASLGKALELEPSDLGIALSILQLVEIYPTESAIHMARRVFEDKLDALQREVDRHPDRFTLTECVLSPTFLLSYHHCDDRPLLEKVHRLVATVAATTPSRLHKSAQPLLQSSAPPWRSQATDHITLVSALFRSTHVIGMLYGGLVRALAEDEGLEICFAYPDYCLETATFIQETSERIHLLPLAATALRAQAQIRQLQSDGVFFLDVDMVPAIYRLAHERLAPLQITSWGTPNTSGMASFDYYLSADSIEPMGAEHAYSETLIRLSRLPSMYTAPSLQHLTGDRAEFGLPADVPLIGVPQSLFKFHPDFDLALEQILARLPTALLVLVAPATPSQQGLLLQRWSRTAPVIVQRSRFLPRMSRDRFLALLDVVDVLLDPFYFGCGNTFYETMAVGTPLVTWPSRFMRGRIVAGGYRQMGLVDAPIARSPDDYVNLVQALVVDSVRRKRLKVAIRSMAHKHLFDDALVAMEFRQFLKAALAACRRKERLTSAWRPVSPSV